MDDETRLQEIKERYLDLDSGPWQWRQSYEVGNHIYWSLESPKSNAGGKVLSYLLVLRHCFPESFGEPVENDPYLNFIAHSRDDMEWLVKHVADLGQERDALWHSLNTMSEYVETLEAQLAAADDPAALTNAYSLGRADEWAEATAWERVPFGTHELRKPLGELRGFLTLTPVRLRWTSILDDETEIVWGTDYRVYRRVAIPASADMEADEPKKPYTLPKPIVT